MTRRPPVREIRSSNPARHSMLTLLFRAHEGASFPLRAAGHDHGTPPAGKRARHVNVADAIQPQLDHVADGAVALGTELFRGVRHDGGADQ
jgi:hypothetical protein